MKFSQHVGVGVITYLVVLLPVVAWILYRQGMPIADLSQNSLNIITKYWWEILVCFFLCVIGSMVPDVDIKSRSQMVIYTLLIIIDLVLILYKYYRESAILGFLAMVPMLTKHREQFHSYIAAVIIPMPLLFIPILINGEFDYHNLGVSYYISALAGYLSHIIADGEGDWH
jgi:energy-converting hydrogenase Eha subunit A